MNTAHDRNVPSIEATEPPALNAGGADFTVFHGAIRKNVTHSQAG
jgi:hypothetical protein